MKKFIVPAVSLLIGYLYGCHRGWVNHTDYIDGTTPEDREEFNDYFEDRLGFRPKGF
jgi:hypothetical protein